MARKASIGEVVVVAEVVVEVVVVVAAAEAAEAEAADLAMDRAQESSSPFTSISVHGEMGGVTAGELSVEVRGESEGERRVVGVARKALPLDRTCRVACELAMPSRPRKPGASADRVESASTT